MNDGFFLSEVNNAITPVVLLGRVIAHDPCLGSGASSNPGDRTARTRGSNFYGARSRKTNLFRTANRAIYHIAQGGYMLLVCAMPRMGICTIHYPPGYVQITKISRFTTRFRHLRSQMAFCIFYMSLYHYLSTSVVMTDVAVVHVPLRGRTTETTILRYGLTAFVLHSQRELIPPSSTRHGQFSWLLSLVIGPSSEHRSYVDSSRDAKELDIKPPDLLSTPITIVVGSERSPFKGCLMGAGTRGRVGVAA